MLNIGLSYIVFVMLSYVLSIPSLFRDFIMKGCWILLKAFSASTEMIWFLYFNIFICYIYWFLYLETFLNLWNEINVIMVHDLFNVLSNMVYKYFIENMYVNSHYRNPSIIFASLYGLDIRVMLVYRMSLLMTLSFLFYGTVWGALELVL
jgi:hypothetical protein